MEPHWFRLHGTRSVALASSQPSRASFDTYWVVIRDAKVDSEGLIGAVAYQWV
jgi:hypothetical protein